MTLLSPGALPRPPSRPGRGGLALSRLASLGPGDRLGDYQIEQVLGRGGMGRVYRAYDPRLKRRAAIKVMGAAAGRDEVRRFEREAQAVAALRHPHILAVYGYGDQDGEPYMVLEFMENGSLADHPDWLPMAPEEVVRILRPVAAALDHAHRRGVIHRDVKPANIFLDADLRPVLGDFGLSKVNRMETLTATGAVTGTPTFVSPEQARGQRLSAASDLYSLAVAAFLLLTGELPFPGAGDALAVLYQHVNEPPPPPSRFRPGLPAEVDAVVLRALAKSPAERWSSAAEFVEALARALGVPAEAPVPAAPRRRVPRLLGAAAAAALVLLLAGGAYALTRTLAPSSAAAPPPTAPAGAAGSLLVDTPEPLRLGGPIHVHGAPLDPARRARIYIEQGGAGAQIEDDMAITIQPDGAFDETGLVNPGLQPGRAVVKACSLDAAGRIVDSTCLRSAVNLAR